MRLLLLALLLALLCALTTAQTGTVFPTTRIPLNPGLTVDDLVNSRITTGLVYNSSTFNIGQDRARYLGDGRLTVTFPALSYVMHILYNYWSTVTTVPFTSDDPSARVYQRRLLPSLEMEYARVRRAGKTYLVPVNVNRLPTSHIFWEWQVQVGECAAHNEYDVCTFAMAYNEKNANAIFNGALVVVFDSLQQVVGLPYFSTTHEQSAYFEHTLFGAVPDVNWFPSEQIAGHGDAESAFNVYWTHAPPFKSLTELPAAVRHARNIRRGPTPIFDLNNNAWNDPETRDFYSSGIDYDFRRKSYFTYTLGTLFVSPVETYIGPLPDNLARWTIYPAYSMGKGLWSGLLYGAINKTYGAAFGNKTIFELPVVGNIPNANSSWDGITLQHLLNMDSRHYTSNQYYFFQHPQADETTAFMEDGYFNITGSAERIDHLLQYPLNAPGWVYKTIDYEGAAYIARNAVEQLLNKTLLDVYEELICKPLYLSKTWCRSTLTTPDARKQEWGGFGSFALISDLAILADFFLGGDGFPILEKDYYESLFPFDSLEIGVPTNVFGARNPDNITRFEGERWSNGVWTNKHLHACPFAGLYRFLSYFSGYGGDRMLLAIIRNNLFINGLKQIPWVAGDLESDYTYYDAPEACYLSNLINPPVGYTPAAA